MFVDIFLFISDMAGSDTMWYIAPCSAESDELYNVVYITLGVDAWVEAIFLIFLLAILNHSRKPSVESNWYMSIVRENRFFFERGKSIDKSL